MRCKPRLGEIPIPLKSRNRHAKHFRSIRFCQSAEKTQFHHFRRTWIEGLQSDQCFIKGQKPIVQSDDANIGIPERNFDDAFPPLLAVRTPGVVQQHAPHLLRRYGIEMRSILTRNWPRAEDPKKSFVQNGGGLQGMLTVLTAHLTRCNPVQIAIDQFHKLVCGFNVAEPPSVEKGGNIVFVSIVPHVH